MSYSVNRSQRFTNTDRYFLVSMILPVRKEFFLFAVSLSLFSLSLKFSHAQKQSRSYYVSKMGSDKNPGTRTRPLKTILTINKLKLSPGDAIYFNGGEVFNGTLSISLNGSKDRLVTVSSYGKGRAVINGANKHAMLIGGSYFRISNINAKGIGRKSGNTTVGIQLIEVRNAIIENVRIEGFQKAGLDLYNCKNTELKKVHAILNGFSGIHVGGTGRQESKNILIKDCKAENNPGDPTNLTNHSGNGILVGMSDSVIIDHCIATNNGWDMPRIGNGPVGIWAYESDHITIQYCIAYRNKTSKGGKDGGGFDLDGGVTNSVIQYCLSYENEGAGYGLFQYHGATPWNNNVVRYCISINDATSTEGSGGIFVWSNDPDSTHLRNCIVHNNLVFSTHAPAVQFEPESLNTNFFFYNNIFIGTGNIINGPSSGEKLVGNIWWPASGEIKFRGYANLADWATATGQEKLSGNLAGKQIDPLLKGPLTTQLIDPYQLTALISYTLQPGSPLKNTGLNLQALFNIPFAPLDFYGTHVPQGSNPEPGIHEMREEEAP